ncbi:polysaccharide deacetylase family protein [Shouchella sp. 1P09AA]|uniref:polysaccharide deacetylase family protein n=1 Tax=unclassified Shouchella TaxID=2893065 RepID=UPI0039A2B3FE
MKRQIALVMSIVIGMIFTCSPISFASVKERHEYEQTGKVFWEANTEEANIALTFDDGPHPANTPELLDILKAYNVKATFFVVGKWAEEYPEIVQRMIDEGHEVANHTYSHNYDEAVTKDVLMEEIDHTNQILAETVGIRPSYFRPVGGYYTDAIIDAALDLDQNVLLWSWHQDPRDWAGTPTKKIVSHIIEHAQAGDVVLLHDGGGDRQETLRAVKLVIPILKHQGYHFVTASELLQPNPLME